LLSTQPMGSYSAPSREAMEALMSHSNLDSTLII
jgi:hypothetical protein